MNHSSLVHQRNRLDRSRLSVDQGFGSRPVTVTLGAIIWDEPCASDATEADS